MPLDVWIHGSGVGETIVLAWHEAGKQKQRAAVIDSFGNPSRPEDCFAIKTLAGLNNPILAFICATHPHYDHVATLPAVIEKHGRMLQRVFWWGGHHRSVVDGMLGVLPEPLSDPVKAIKQFMRLTCDLAGDSNPGGIVSAQEYSFTGVRHVYSAPLPEDGERLEIWSISPFLGPQKKFRESLEKSISASGEVEALKLSAVNDASLAFLIQYGRSQLILGGDTGTDNWRCAFQEWQRLKNGGTKLPDLDPDVIKVSHHGSKTAVPELQQKRPLGDPDMWQAGKGFFGMMQERETQPVAVITPWTSRLPEDAVIKLIKEAGFKTFVTNSVDTKDPIAGGRPLDFEDCYVRLSLAASGGTPEVSLASACMSDSST